MVKKEKKSPRGDKRRKDAPALIAELFRSLPDKRYSVKSLMAAVGATTRDEKERVRGIVRDLAAEGVIEQVSEGKYRLSHSERETVEGTVDMTSSGALYVIVEGMDKDIYVNASRTSHALHGDRVRVAITRKGRTGNPEGEVVEIVERSKKNYVGVVEMSEGDAFAFVRVDSRKMATDIFVPARALHGAKGGEKVLVKITGWPDTMRSPEGEIVDVFGEPGDNNAEMHAILAEFDLPYGYPEEVEWLLKNGYSPSLPALQGFGYRELVDYLAGRCTFLEAIEGDIRSTKAFSRRQTTWFKHFEPAVWFDFDEISKAEALRRAVPLCLAHLNGERAQ